MGNDQSNLTFKDKAVSFLIFISIVVVFVIGASFLAKALVNDREQVEEIVKEVVKEKEITITRPKCDSSFEEFTDLKSKGQYLELVSNHNTYASAGEFVNLKDTTVNISGKDDVACGYLHLKANRGGSSLHELYDSFYINPHQFGGHLLRAKGILNRNYETETEVLIPLDAVSYLPGLPYNPEAKDFRIANWVNLLNVNSHVTFSLALSVEDPSAILETVGIAYKCWDQETGEESTGCQLSIN